MSYEKIKTVLEAAAKKAGLTEYEIYYSEHADCEIETLKNEISSFSRGRRGGICFRTIVNGKIGYASTELMEEDEMEALVSRAAENALYIESEEEGIIYSGSPEYKKTEVPEFIPMNTSYMKETALGLQQQLYRESEYVADGSVTCLMSGELTIHLSNSHGLNLTNHVGYNGAYAYAVVKKDGDSVSDSASANGCKNEDFADLPKKAVSKAIAKVGAGLVESGKYNIVISGRRMRAILGAFVPVFYAKNAQTGMSLLAGKENSAIAAEIVTIVDNPFLDGYSVQTHFDSEGVATYRKNVVEKGVLKTLLYNLTTAKKAGVESTANASKGGYSANIGTGTYSCYIEKGDKTTDELLAEAGNGIYITEVKGLHAGTDSVTGDFSIESGGFVIENGKIGKPVKSFTIAGNFFDLLKNITAISDTVDFEYSGGYSNIGSPDVLITGMSVAGK